MANKYFSKRLTVRELVLLIFLITALFIGLYFWLVYYPIRDRIAELNAQQDELSLRVEVAEIRKRSYDEMKRELDEILKDEAPTVMPPYDNILALNDKIAAIFPVKDNVSENSPNITYNTPTLEDGIYTRSLHFVFRCVNYDSAKSILLKLLGTGFRCQMKSLSMTAETGGYLPAHSLTVDTEIEFYELA